MTGLHSTGLVPAVLLLANAFLPVTTAQTATLDIPTGLPASCTPLATLLSDYPPPKDGQIVDKALNNGLDVAISQTTTEFDDITAFCGYIISTQIPSATPSVTSALSSYISAAGIWLEEHGLEQAESLLDGDCDPVVQLGDYDAQADLDFVVGFGQCYEALGWDKRTSGSGATTTTTNASSIPTVSATVTSTSTSISATTASQSESAHATASPTGQTDDKGAPPNAGSRRVADAPWLLGAIVCVMLLLS
ncbi:hypothetical protein F5Y01DRAFT_266711 [Xylaria sp. FL0043]|nr:hypothetical protein F5Y01DRAFT_266711 [Xylaria sp. FL0043]